MLAEAYLDTFLGYGCILCKTPITVHELPHGERSTTSQSGIFRVIALKL